MLSITEFDRNNNYRTLQSAPGGFHEALKHVLRGETRFHVRNGGGADYDLVYTPNDARAKADATFPDSAFFKSELIFPPYYFYDEDDTDRINLDLLDGFDEVFFEEANEYTLAVARLALRHTGLAVTFADARAGLCAWLAGRVTVRKAPETANALYVQREYYPVYVTRDRFCALGLFHSMFLLQWLTDLPREKIRYLELTIRKTEGIGSVLSTFSKARQAFERLGITVYLAPGCTRYSDRMLSRYFKLGMAPKDATPSNTAYVKCFNAFVLNHFIQRNPGELDLGVLQPAFLAQMREYADQVLGGKKALGVLLRGTDYVIANYAGNYRPVDIDDCVRVIRGHMERYGYDCIFLATEDQSFLERMLLEFPRRVIAVSQERHSVSDFGSVKFISELEKREHTGSDYEAMVEDTTVNYLYAMYMLSRCESLLANCMCSGVYFATSFNGGKYVRNEIVADLLSKP